MRASRSEPIPVGEARIHVDDAADRAARAVRAQAVTTGRDIYFAAGRYRPGTAAGDALLAHELIHVAQDAASPPPMSGPVRVSEPGERSEVEAARAAGAGVPAAAPPRVSKPGRVLHRQLEELLVGYLAYRYEEGRVAAADPVELQGHGRFAPSAEIDAFLDVALGAVDVRARFGSMGEGVLSVWRDEDGRLNGIGRIPLSIPGIPDDNPLVSPMLLAWIDDGEVSGIFGGVTQDQAAGNNHAALAAALFGEGAKRLVEWRGIENANLVGHGNLFAGQLELPRRRFDFDLNGVFRGNATLAFRNSVVTFEAEAELDIPGLDRGTIHLARDEFGNLSGNAHLRVQKAGFEGSLLATFGHGLLDIRGTASYSRKGFQGTVTLLVTDAQSAWAAVDGELAQWDVAARAVPPGSVPDPSKSVATAQNLVVVGWGTVDFRYKDWLEGRAQVIVDPAGDITSLGRVHLPRDIEVFGPKRFTKPLFDPIHVHKVVASAWGVVDVGLEADISAEAAGGIGPMVLTNLRAAGAFSTRPGFQNTLMIGGRLEVPADFSVTLHLHGAVTVEAIVEELQIASTNINVTARGELEARASADASIHRQQVGSDDARYLLEGTLSAGGSATLTFSGNVDVRIPAVGYRKQILDFGHHRWLLGTVHVSTTFRNYEVGSNNVPPQHASVQGFDGDRLASTIIDRKGVPAHPGPEDAAAEWTPPSGFRPDAVVEGEEPVSTSFPADPRLGGPAVPPQAPAPAQQPDQPQGDGGSDAGPTDAGPTDAGVPPIAGVPEQPPPPEDFPTPPEPAATPHRELVEDFDMEGVKHELKLEPGEPPVLLMASAPGRLVLKLMRKKDELELSTHGEPGRRAIVAPQIEVLDELISEARQVESQAEQLGFGDRFSGHVPGLRALADHLHAVALQFDWNDIVTYLPTEQVAQPPSTEPGTEPVPVPSQEVLGLPYQQFLAATDTMQPAEALLHLREQRRYYDQEVQDINRYLGLTRSRGSAESTRAQDNRRNELFRRIAELDRRIRRLEDQTRPDARPTLPCFTPETPVLTPNGAMPIGSLSAGDTVWSYDVGAERLVEGRVEQVHRNLALRLVRVTAAGAVLRATGRHPFWVEEAGEWVAAEALAPGMHLRLHDGGPAEVEAVETEKVVDAPTVDLSISPHPTYFVGPGILVHNAPPIPAPRHYSWRDSTGASVPAGNQKIYLGVNQAAEWANCIYVGRTNQAIEDREDQHRKEAQDWLDKHPGEPANDRKKRFYRFKSDMHITAIVTGLRNKDQAQWLEQKNFNYEQYYLKHEVMYLREELDTSGPDVEARIREDPIVRASKYCP